MLWGVTQPGRLALPGWKSRPSQRSSQPCSSCWRKSPASPGARCAWSVSADPDDSDRRHFLPARFSYGPRPGGMAFRIHDGLIAWEPTNVIARRRRSRAVEEVMLWLENLLQGQVLPCRMIQQQARECGFTTYSLRAARIELGVQIGKQGFNENTNWCWSLGVPAALPEPAIVIQ